MDELSTRIVSKYDTLANWTSENPILLQGEIAVVFDGNNQLFKAGDGSRHFNDLPFAFYEQFASKQVFTDILKAKSIDQGYGARISGIGGIATGYKSQVSANFAQAHGYQTNVSSDFGYVWNGDNAVSGYADHGQGTYNINPRNGISGLYIGDKSLKEIISQEAPEPDLSQYYKKNETSSASEIQIALDNIPQPDMSEYAKLSSLEALSAEVDPVKQDVLAQGGYSRVYADKMNNLVSTADGMKIVLDNYSFSKSYVMKFTTPISSEVKFQFYTDTGTGPQLDPDMNINTSYRFPMNSGYVVEVKFDAMDIRPLEWTGDRQKMTFRTIEWVEEDE